MPVTTDFAGTETLAETKSRLGTLLTAYGYDSSGYSTWGDARTDLNSALTAIEETTISDGELASSFRSKLNALNALSDYPVLTFFPDLIFDFENEVYRTDNASDTFSSAITHSATTNATMVDSDGVLKWRPHNLLTYSEQFDNWSGVAFGSGILPVVTDNGSYFTVELDRGGDLVGDQSQIVSSTFAPGAAGIQFTAGVRVRAATPSDVGKEIAIRHVGVASYGVVTLTSDWQDATRTESAASSSNYSLTIGTRGTVSADQVVAFDIERAFIHRSDLGGMVDNPDIGESYVPTTSAARYLPRRGHHVWNGSAWVNEGLLHESEARTNLLTYSEDLSNAAWTKPSAITIGTPVTRKGVSLDLIESDGTVNFTQFNQSIGSVADGACLTFSVFIEAGTSTETAIRIDDVATGATSNRVAVPITWTSGVPSLQVDASLGLTFVDASLQDFGDGLYRVHLTVLNGTGGALTLYPKYYVQWDDTAAAVNTYAGGFQAELGPTPSSYIPTSGSTVTRAAETLTIPAAKLPYSATAMSIQMDGRMTYADEGTSGQQSFLRWSADGNNFILFQMDTDVGTGRVRGQQAASGVFDGAFVSNNDLAPGVFVPFSLASRHGSTFIQLAVDGTSGNENTTPVALADLSTDNLNLGYDYMGTIRTFRMWGVDIGDSGIEEASA